MQPGRNPQPAKLIKGLGLRLCYALVGALALASLAAPASASAQDSNVTIDVSVVGDELTIALSDVDDPVGALEIRVGGLPPLGDDECLISGGGFGACNSEPETTTFVAANPTGWDHDIAVITVDLAEAVDPAALDVELVLVADVTGQPMTGRLGTDTVGAAGAGDTKFPIVAVLVGIGAALAAVGVGTVVARSRNVNNRGDMT